ncbi:MAG TPA: hypothetical protein VGN63_09905 [Flavisolibacter sp.]|jgi:hypothetical protein|nr:hypothetical protein [Flavisolibacter sp.]
MNNNNSKAIRTYEDLVEEEKRLTVHLAALKLTLKEDIAGVKDGLKEKMNPIRKVKEKARSFFTRADKNSPTLNFAINFVLDYFLRLFIPNRTSVWTKTVIPFVTKNYVSHLITEEQRAAIAKFWNDTAMKVEKMMQKSKQNKEDMAEKEAAAMATEGTIATPSSTYGGNNL